VKHIATSLSYSLAAVRGITTYSARLTDQRGSYAICCSTFTIHLRHILPTSNIYSLLYYLFSRHQWTACVRAVNRPTVLLFDALSSGTPVNNPNGKWPLRAIQGHLFQCHCKATISASIFQYNNWGLVCESSEYIMSERSENRHFQWLHCYLALPLQRTPANIHIILILSETIGFPGYIFCRW